MSFKGFKSKVEFIKKEFGKYYRDKGPENGILQGMRYNGAATHCRNCLATLVKMVEAKTVLEIGSWHYECADAMAYAMDELYGHEGFGLVDSFDIRRGGYDGMEEYQPKSKRVNARFWYPHHSQYDDWKYAESIVYPEFKNLKNEEISQKNVEILKKVTAGINHKYDLIFIDGDHSFEGVWRDFEISKQFADKNTLFVIDNVWDQRLVAVREFYESLNLEKWDFRDWNDQNYKNNLVQDTAICIL